MGARQQRTLPIQAEPVTLERQAHHPRYERPAVRERLPALGPRARLHPDRHLGAVPAATRPPLPVRLRERHPWHADHAAGRAGGHRAGGSHRARRRRARARLRDLSNQRRQLPEHARARRTRSSRPSSTGGSRPAVSSAARRSSKRTTSSGRCSCPTVTCAEPARSAARPINTATPARAAARRIRRSSSRTPSRRSPARRRRCASPSICS